jgi:hypothetical protein
MAVPYPSSPAVGDSFTYLGVVYTWNGVAWISEFTNTPGSVGSVAVTAPITNSGTPTAPVIGISQGALTIDQSQVTNLVSDLAGKASTSDLTSGLALKANLAGGNALTGTQTVTITGSSGTNVLGLKSNTDGGGNLLNVRFESANGNLFDLGKNETSNQSGSFYLYTPSALPIEFYNGGTKRLIVESNGNINIGGATGAGSSLAKLSLFNTASATIAQVVRGAASQSANLQEWQSSAGTVLARIASTGQLLAPSIVGTAFQITSGGIFSNGATSAPANVQAYFLTTAATNAGLVVRGASSQSANLLELQNSAGTVMANFDPSGFLNIPNASLRINTAGASYGARIQTATDGTGVIGIVVRATSGQTANLQEWQNSSATAIARLASGGNFVSSVSGNTFGTGSTANSVGVLNVFATSSTTVGALIRGAASQTADLQQWQNSAGTNLASITSAGFINVNSSQYGNAILFSAPASTTYYLLATLPISNAGTYDHIKIDATYGTWTTGQQSTSTFMFSNRDGFIWRHYLSGQGTIGNIKVRAYSQVDGSVQLWVSGEASQYVKFTYNISSVQNVTVVANPVSTTTAPSGTVVFDSSNVATYPPVEIQHGGLNIYATTAGTSPLVVRGAASQTASVLAFQNSAGSITANFTAPVNNVNRLNLGGTDLSATLGITVHASGGVGQIIRGAASQSSNLLEIQNSAASVLVNVSSAGQLNALQGVNTNTIRGLDTLSAITVSNGRGITIGTSSAIQGGGTGVIGIANAGTVPTSSPTGGGILFVETGALKYRGTSGSAATIVNADGTVPGGGGSFTGGTLTSNLTLAAGTTTLSPLTYQSGTNLTTVTAGANEYDGTVFYQTSNTNPGRALATQNYYYVLSADWNPDFSVSATAKSLLGAATRGITVAAGTTYEFEVYTTIQHDFVTNSGITASFDIFNTTVSGSPVVSDVMFVDFSSNTTGFTTSSAMSSVRSTTAVVVSAAISSGSRYTIVKAKGIIRITGTGTTKIYPGIFTSASSGDNGWTIGNGTTFKMTPIGNGTVNSVGTWA